MNNLRQARRQRFPHPWLKRPMLLLLLLIIITPVVFLLALGVGSVPVTGATLLQILSGNQAGMQHDLVMHLRLPRAASAFATGGMLALAGVLMQVLLRNPLADPYILGISGGAAVAALLAMLAGMSGIGLSGCAFAGALLSMLLVFSLARGEGAWTSTRLLLCGVVLAAGWGAVISFILATSKDTQVQSMLFWLMGDLSYNSHTGAGILVLMLGLLLCLPMARGLNLLSHGDLLAASLGLEVKRLRWQIYCVASLLAASAVTLAGSIGFVGLVIPHLVRLMGIHDHRLLLPASTLLGGSFLLVADSMARTIIAPQQLPVGVITALLGIPLFLYFMRRTMSTDSATRK